jgi:hypothetical protein
MIKRTVKRKKKFHHESSINYTSGGNFKNEYFFPNLDQRILSFQLSRQLKQFV